MSLLKQIPFNARETYVKVTDHDGTEGYIPLRIKVAVDNAVPWEWAHLFCNCYAATASDFVVSGNGDGPYRDARCGKCGRRPRWQLVYCVCCRELKPWVFIHHNRRKSWSPGDAMGLDHPFNDIPAKFKYASKAFCWDCLVKTYGTIEGDTPPPSDLIPRKVLTAEELMADTSDPFDGFDF